MLDRVGFPDPARAFDIYSVRAVRRPAPARHDRHGADLPAGAADRRRADHRARRDHPGADPRRCSSDLQAETRHGDPAHHPRSRRRRQHGRRGGGDLPRRDHGSRPGRGHLPPARSTPTCKALLNAVAAFRHGAGRAPGAAARGRAPRPGSRPQFASRGQRDEADDRPLLSGARPDARPTPPARAASSAGHADSRARRRRRQLRHQARRMPRPRRRERLRQDDASARSSCAR